MASKERRRERYAEDPAYREEQLAASRRFYQANKKKISERKRRWRKENPEYREKEVIRQRKKALESYGGSLEAATQKKVVMRRSLSQEGQAPRSPLHQLQQHVRLFRRQPGPFGRGSQASARVPQE